MSPESGRLRSVAVRLRVYELDEGYNDTRVELIIRDATGHVLGLPLISLLGILGDREIRWDIPDWNSGLVKFPIRIDEVRFWETGPNTWGNMNSGCKGALAVASLNLTTDDYVSLRFSVANARTVQTSFAAEEMVSGETFSTANTETEGYADTQSLEVSFNQAAGTYSVRLTPRIAGRPIHFSLMARTDISNLTVRPVFTQAGHYDNAALRVAAKPVAPGDVWQDLEWEIPFAGRGLVSNTVWQHALVYPLRLERLEVNVPARTTGRLLLDDVAFLNQLPEEERLFIASEALLSRAETGLFQKVSVSAVNRSLKPLETTLDYVLSDACGTNLVARTARLSLKAGESAALDLRPVDFNQAEGPFRLSVQTDGVPVSEKTIFMSNARVLLRDFDRQEFINGGSQTAEAAKAGRYGIEVKYGKGSLNHRITGIRAFLPGCPQKLQLWVKGGSNNVYLAVSGHDRGPNADTSSPDATYFTTPPVLVDWTGWRQVSFSLPQGIYPLAERPTRHVIDYPILVDAITVTGNPGQPGTLCLDDLSTLTEVPRAELVDVSLDLRLPSRLFITGDPCLAVVENRSLTEPLRGSLRFELFPGSAALFSTNASPLVSRDVPLALDPGARSPIPVGVSLSQAGPFHVRWTVVSGAGEVLFSNVEETLSIVLAPAEAQSLERGIADAPNLYRLGSLRTETLLLDWNAIEPWPGDVRYDAYDRRLARLLPVCPDLVARLGFATLWNSPGGVLYQQSVWEGDAYQYPNDLKAWYYYVYETVRRYKGRVKYWEVWNEPAKAQDEIEMTLAMYRRLLLLANAAIREVDPAAKIIMGTMSLDGTRGYLEAFLKEGGGDLVDIIGIDPVNSLLDPETGAVNERVREVVELVRKLSPKTQVWVTSMAWQTSDGSGDGGLPESVQADYLARGKALCLAAGVDRVADWLIGALTVRNSAGTVYRVNPRKLIRVMGELPPLPNWYLKPSFLTVRTANEMLDGARFIEETLLADSRPRLSRAYLFEAGTNGLMAVLWRRRGTSAMSLADLPAPVRGCDAYGNPLDLRGGLTLSPSPCYLFFPDADRQPVVDRLPLATIAYDDHADALWKQRLLDDVDRSQPTREAHRYAATGADAVVTGEYRPGLDLRQKVARINGSEAFDADLSALGNDDLILIRRVDLAQTNQSVTVKIDGQSVAHYDLTPLNRITESSPKRFFDLPLRISRAALQAKGKARVEFAAVASSAGPTAPFTSVATRFYAKKPGSLYLSDIDFVSAQQSLSILRQDENMLGEPLRLGGRLVRKGLATHAKSQIVYFLGGQFKTFSVQPGIETTGEEGGSAVFMVVADGKEIYRSDIVTAYTKVEPLTIAVEGCQVLELRVGDGGDSIAGDWAIWADARVE